MVNVKLIVLFVFVSNISVCYSNYCRICPSHTLCMYKRSGPGPLCRSYDKTALITKEDVETIVNKINQRRNFVALGLARNLPSAANMNQMRWSEELALSAQRWADQCDPALRPDKKDLCRDTAGTEVGQNIATVTGLSPGLSVKSFVEIWYMQALDYKGSVTYYNQSDESKTNDFTKLIWAETTLVGCGKARFSIDDKGTMIDRLVCNFAPKGNVRGKPVYTIGYPATQCKENSRKDETFTGLCSTLPEKPPISVVSKPTESSLLRIVDLSKIPVKMDIDPLRLDYKNLNHDLLSFMRHQNLRHIPNFTRVHHVTPASARQNRQEYPKLDVIPRQHQHADHPQSVRVSAIYRTRFPVEQYRRNDNRETIPSYYDVNLKRRTYGQQCTRNSGTTHNNYNACKYPSKKKIPIQDQCTRTAKNVNEYILTTQASCKKKDVTVHICNTQTPTCIVSSTTTPYNCNFNCHCLNINHQSPASHRRIPGEYDYYDYIPNLALRNGEEWRRPDMKHYDDSIQMPTTLPQDRNNENSNNDYFTHDRNEYVLNDQSIQKIHRKNSRNRNRPYLVNLKVRAKRQVGQHFSDTSFWKIDESKKQSQKRSPLGVRYTTLANNMKERKFRTFGHIDLTSGRTFRTIKNIEITIEPITRSVEDLNSHRHDATDRSLSFEELMNFRKSRGEDVDISLRRNNKKATPAKKTNKPKPTAAKTNKPKPTAAKTNKPKTTAAKTNKPNNSNKKKLSDQKIATAATTTTHAATTTPHKAPTTTLMTLVGSFSPQSACTRRVTCTWTMPKITDANGNVINGGGGSGSGGSGGKGGGGGRTPWGHVENCTRKYTCSRIYYDRNVQASDTAAGDTTVPDEDYCERRALDVKRRDLETRIIKRVNRCKSLNENYSLVTLPMKNYNTINPHADCSCNDHKLKKKRSVLCVHNEKNVEKYTVKKKDTPNNLLILGKILKLFKNSRIKEQRNKRSKCPRNTSITVYMYNNQYLIYFAYFLRLLN